MSYRITKAENRDKAKIFIPKKHIKKQPLCQRFVSNPQNVWIAAFAVILVFGMIIAGQSDAQMLQLAQEFSHHAK